MYIVYYMHHFYIYKYIYIYMYVCMYVYYKCLVEKSNLSPVDKSN